MERMADKAASLAPEESGRLSFSVTVSEKPTRRAAWKNGVFKSQRSTSIVIAMGPGAGFGTLEYATFVEFGTIDTAADPFMRPAWDSEAQRALDYVQDNLWAEVSAAAERLARKTAKAKA